MNTSSSSNNNHHLNGAAAAERATTPLLSIEMAPPVFPFLLAPMAGFTDSPFRRLCMLQGAGLCYTELVVAEGFARSIPATMLYLRVHPEEQPVGCHIYGSNPDSMARAAEKAQQMGTFTLVDINAGCPVKKVTSKGAGAALLQDPQRVYDIIAAMRQASDLPITLKTRIGKHRRSITIYEMADAAQQAGAQAITVHGRFASDFHKGESRWDILKELKTKLRIPLIGNGGANDAASAIAMLRETGVDAVMIGRAALGNPWIFTEIRAQLEKKAYTPPTADEKKQLILIHLQHHLDIAKLEKETRPGIKLPAEVAGCRTFLSPLLRYFAGQPGARKQITAHPLDSQDQIKVLIDALLQPSR